MGFGDIEYVYTLEVFTHSFRIYATTFDDSQPIGSKYGDNDTIIKYFINITGNTKVLVYALFKFDL